MFVALYCGQSADATVKAAQGFVTIDFLDFARMFLVNPTRDTVSPRQRGGSVEAKLKSQRRKENILIEYSRVLKQNYKPRKHLREHN